MNSIATRFLLPVVALAAMFMGLNVYQGYQNIRKETAELVGRQAAMAMAFDLAIRSYVADEIRPAMEERVAPGDFFPETMSTSFVARSIFDKVRQDFPDYTIKFSSDDPRNSANQAGPEELRMIQYFNDHPEVKQWSGEIDLGGRPHIAHFNARRMKERCLHCHGNPEDAPASLVERYGPTAGFHRPVGEVIALDTVAIPIDKVQAAVMAKAFHHIAFLAAGVGVFVALVALVFRFVVSRRLAMIRTHFERIASEPNAVTMQPAEARGNDEITALVRSFNTMVDRVRDAHASLEQRVADQTAGLRTAHAEIRQLFEAFSSVLIGVDKDGRVTAWNGTAERTFGIEKDKAVGQLFGDLELEWDQPSVTEGISECLASSVPRRLDEVRFKKPDGADGFLGMTLNPLNGGPDKHGGFLLVAMDITEQKILQSQLGEAQKLESIGQLAAGIAHEINTPIQYVGDNVRFLSDSVGDLFALIGSYRDLTSEIAKGADAEDCVSKAATLEQEADLTYIEEEVPKSIAQSLDGVGRVSKIVRAMKDFSHPGGDDKQMADLNKAIESTITVARSEWKYGAEVITDFDSSLPLVPCLLGDFNQMILNMIVNAAHAITDVVGKNSVGKGTISISTRQDGVWAEIRVSDTGTGIPEGIRSKIFDPFFTTKDVGKGTGQGLAIARTTVVNKHGGELRVESEVGHGTTFIIRLPIEAESDGQAGAQRHEEANSLRR